MDAVVEQAKPAATLDPITLEVIRHGLIAITNQIDANITRTAFSPYIYEYKDFAVGMTDADGQLVAQSTGGMPPFVARVYADAKWAESIIGAVADFEQVAEGMTHEYDLATRGMPSTERRRFLR